MLWQKPFLLESNDLVAAEAKYHHDCFISFLKLTTGVKVGRTQDENTNLAMEEIFTYLYRK